MFHEKKRKKVIRVWSTRVLSQENAMNSFLSHAFEIYTNGAQLWRENVVAYRP